MNTLIDTKGWSKLFKMYYNIDISEQFLNCADSQLTGQFVNATGIKIERTGILNWEQNKAPEITEGRDSTITALIRLKYGEVPVKIVWSSKSGKIYGISDAEINCADIEFTFDTLNVEQCKRYHKPDFSKFFTFYEGMAPYLKNAFGVEVSTAFVLCMREHLTTDFEFKTGLKVNKNIEIVYSREAFFYEKGELSRTQATIYVNNNWNDRAQIWWKSKSGRIYEMTDVEIDCSDIDMWFENLEPEVYYSQLYPNDPFPFKLKNLTYTLTINRIKTDCEVQLILKNDYEGQIETVLQGIYDFVNKFNEESESKDRQMGLVHNASGTIQENKIVLSIDLGSSGADFFKKLLTYFSSLAAFESVNVE